MRWPAAHLRKPEESTPTPRRSRPVIVNLRDCDCASHLMLMISSQNLYKPRKRSNQQVICTKACPSHFRRLHDPLLWVALCWPAKWDNAEFVHSVQNLFIQCRICSLSAKFVHPTQSLFIQTEFVHSVQNLSTQCKICSLNARFVHCYWPTKWDNFGQTKMTLSQLKLNKHLGNEMKDEKFLFPKPLQTTTN